MNTKQKILIVDDKVENLIALETILGNLDVEFVRALSGAEALEKTLEHDFSIALIDVQMPDMDGFETVKLMRDVKKTRLLPVIFISAVYSENYYKLKGVETGAIDFIAKPIVKEILLGKVCILLELDKEKKKLEQEIKRRLEIEKELKVSNDQLKLMNKILRHDILNYLAGMKSALRLYEKANDAQFLKEVFLRVDKSVELIQKLKLLEDFIFSKKKLKLYNIQDLIKRVKRSYFEIDVYINGTGKVLADDALSSVLDNIISNARIHGKSNRIDITIEQKGKFCEIRIADNGTGIPDKIKERIFEESFSYGETGQTGLGLYIVKKVVEKYGGTINVEDNEPEGAVFILNLMRGIEMLIMKILEMYNGEN